MAKLKGGTTINGYTALHSGLREAFFLGSLSINEDLNVSGNIKIAAGKEIHSGHNNNYIIKDHGNGNVTLSAAGSNLQLGYQNTSRVVLNSNLRAGSNDVINTSGQLFYQGVNTDTRYLRGGTDSYVYGDTNGSTSYPRIVFGNSGASSPAYFRANATTGGFLPYSNGNSYVGTSSWRFAEMHAVNFHENGTRLSSKYATSGHNHDGSYVSKTGDGLTGPLRIAASGNNARMTLVNSGANEARGASIDLLETGDNFESSNANGFQLKYDASSNHLRVTSKYSGTTEHLSIARNGRIIVNSELDLQNDLRAARNIYWDHSGAAGGRLGVNTGGWVFMENIESNAAIRLRNNGVIQNMTNTEISGNLTSSGIVRGQIYHTDGYFRIYPRTAAMDDGSYVSVSYRGDGSATAESTIHWESTSTTTDLQMTLSGKNVPRLGYGTGSPPNNNSWRNGDVWVQY